MKKSWLEDFIGGLTPEEFFALKVLSVSTVLNDSIAGDMISRAGVIGVDVKNLKDYSLCWHDRTNKTWIINADIRRLIANDMIAEEKERFTEIAISAVIEYSEQCFQDKKTGEDMADYYFQIIRMALQLGRNRTWAISKIGAHLRQAKENNMQERIRILLLYLKEVDINMN